VVDAAHGRDRAARTTRRRGSDVNERAIARADSSSDPDARNWRASLLNTWRARHDAKQGWGGARLLRARAAARREM
jgi:hypothetical protein